MIEWERPESIIIHYTEISLPFHWTAYHLIQIVHQFGLVAVSFFWISIWFHITPRESISMVSCYCCLNTRVVHCLSMSMSMVSIISQKRFMTITFYVLTYHLSTLESIPLQLAKGCETHEYMLDSQVTRTKKCRYLHYSSLLTYPG